MRHQPADSNNPSNPLFKVASLTLDKEYLKIGKEAIARIVVRLSFKSSNDLRGHAKTSSGEHLTVCFSLSVQRASFQLSFVLDDGSPVPKELLEINDVAFHVPLEVRDKIVETVKAQSKIAKYSDVNAKGKTKFGIDRASLNAQGSTEISRHAMQNESTKQSLNRQFEQSNVNVTIAPDMIHWEINPISSVDVRTKKAPYLNGEVFMRRTARATKPVDACVVSWKREEANSALVITGSVFTLMEDLAIQNIRLLNDLGEKIPWRKVEMDGSSVSSKLMSSVQSTLYSKAKERFVRQIIRKHLVLQGMTSDGARVEISKAHV